jgi:hypothetical protein
VIAAIAGVALAGALVYGLLVLRRALPVAPSALDAALAVRPRPAKVESLDRAENIVAIAVASAGDAHWRLRPILREAAAAALHGRGIDLDADPDAARGVLGDEAFELVRADRPRPPDAFAPGVDPQALDRILARIEDLQR